jgi:adenine-specific DNA-methyltransferase
MAVKNKSTKKNVSNSEKLQVETIIHDEATRKNIPTAEYQSIIQKNDQTPIQVAYEKRNRDLDPQLVWRGKDLQDWSNLIVSAPPLYIQEKVHPKVLIDDLKRQSQNPNEADDLKLFADFNGLPNEGARTEFYQHDSHWTNRMILGDSLQVMASLAEREGLRGKVQCVFIDPPYGIKFNSNFQWSTTSRDVKDGKADHITREPEQVKAFRDTWRDGIHSYLTYLRDRLLVAHDLLNDSGAIFVQISDENIHRVRILMDEIFGDSNYVSTINFVTTGGLPSTHLSRIGDYILLYAKDKSKLKWRKLKENKKGIGEDGSSYNKIEESAFNRRSATTAEKADPTLIDSKWKVYTTGDLGGQGGAPEPTPFNFQGKIFNPSPNSHWKPNYPNGLRRLARASRVEIAGNTLRYVRFFEDNPSSPLKNIWLDTGKAGFASDKTYVVETNTSVIERCILMTTDPGDLVLDPTCGSGTTAFVAEQFGRRWITMDTSRVAMTLARARIMGARYPYYLLSDSKEGKLKEAELSGTIANSQEVYGRINYGFVYERVPHITLKSIANNTEIDVIWDEWQKKLKPIQDELSSIMNKTLEEWEIPPIVDINWPDKAKKLHGEWWRARISRQKEIDKSIASNADFEFLYDKPIVDKKIVRVAGPFTVESVSPHKVLGVDIDDSFLNKENILPNEMKGVQDFTKMILENLKNAGVQQAHKEGKINFTSLNPWPGQMISAEGFFIEHSSGKEKRAAIFIGPEFGTVSRPDLVEAAKEAGDADFDVLIACAFNYDAMASDFQTLGRIPLLKARMNADLHMADDLKNTGKGNLFVVFGEPDIEIKHLKESKIQVKIHGVDIFHPNTGEVKSDGAEGIACWFIDTDYNEESFFVRHAYFLGANDPYKALKTSLKAEIDKEAWDSLNSDTSRPFEKPKSGRIAIKVINHLGDEVMKVFKVN